MSAAAAVGGAEERGRAPVAGDVQSLLCPGDER
jgi:hypothetical protein